MGGIIIELLLSTRKGLGATTTKEREDLGLWERVAVERVDKVYQAR